MMKTLLLALATFFSMSTTHAAESSRPNDFLKPIRQVTGRVKIMKFTITKTTSGLYEYLSTPICQKDVVVDVYDMRNSRVGDAYVYGPVTSCDAEILGRKVEIEAVAVVALSKHAIFDQEPESDLRANFFSLQSRDASGGLVQHASGSVVTRDLLSSTILEAQERSDWKCEANGTCGPSSLETISGVIEFGP